MGSICAADGDNDVAGRLSGVEDGRSGAKTAEGSSNAANVANLQERH